MKEIILLVCFLLNSIAFSFAETKYLIDDFEGLSERQMVFKKEGIFSFGNIAMRSYRTGSDEYTGDFSIFCYRAGNEDFGGWGKGLSAFINIDPSTDHLNFYLRSKTSADAPVNILIQEDDDHDGQYNERNDDTWAHQIVLGNGSEWTWYSIPLGQFNDFNKGGDNKFNANYREGKVLTVVFSFPAGKIGNTIKPGEGFFFDHITISDMKHDPKRQALAAASCMLGAWSEEGNWGRYDEIGYYFEANFKRISEAKRKINVIHVFQPFSYAKGKNPEFVYPDLMKISNIVKQGYIPMITLENHFVNINKKVGQPNLYSIMEGHYDNYFKVWATMIKSANTEVWLRILHEFNGNWYPWCLSENNHDAQLYKNAYRHIVEIFKANGANNVKFIWCPNSMSVPQERWNNVQDCYPGDDVVDFIGMDIYNGASDEEYPVWRSFKKEATEMYYTLTKNYPNKALFVCEVSCRERKKAEGEFVQSKADWIVQMSRAIVTEMPAIKLICWFNETDKFKVNSSKESVSAFAKEVWFNSYFTLNGLKKE